MKIKEIEFINNPKIGNLKIDFSTNGIINDTIILAGNNGCGKTTILDSLNMLANLKEIFQVKNSSEILKFTILFENKDIYDPLNPENLLVTTFDYTSIINCEILISITFSQKTYMDRVKIFNLTTQTEFDSHELVYLHQFELLINSFYSTADINYKTTTLSSITSIELDSKEEKNIKTSDNIGNQIQQTFIDISYLDAQDFQEWGKSHVGEIVDETKMNIRIKRFQQAFNYIMNDLKFKKIQTHNNFKSVLFERNNKEISLNNLSSGEKQLIIRGGFFLRFQKSIQNSIILIDEPELSLHPEWQKKILQFYKNLFIDENGNQSSQIFVATHSPFIIHNDNRYNDKVIILNKDSNGEITVSDSPKYYNANSIEIVKDAFNINEFSKQDNILFVEGETDKLYIDKCIELFFNNKVPFLVEWIGSYQNSNKSKAINTGKDGLNNLLKILEANKNLFNCKIGLLYDSDTCKSQITTSEYFTYTLPNIPNKHYKIGIENQLDLPPTFNYNQFYKTSTKINDYGGENIISELEKTNLCQYICSSSEVFNYLQTLKNTVTDIISKF